LRRSIAFIAPPALKINPFLGICGDAAERTIPPQRYYIGSSANLYRKWRRIFRRLPPAALEGAHRHECESLVHGPVRAVTGEWSFVILMVVVGCLTTGFSLDVIMKDLALDPAPNGVLAFIGVCAGIYLRYRLFAPFRANDSVMTIGFAMGCAFLLFIGLGVAKSRVLWIGPRSRHWPRRISQRPRRVRPGPLDFRQSLTSQTNSHATTKH